LKESKYVRLASTIYRVLRNSRTPLFLHRKSNHVFSLWQHIVLLTVRQYEGKSYRMFAEWLFEAYYLRMFLQLSHIPHYTTLQKLAARINGTILAKIIASFIILTGTRHIFAGIDSTGFKLTHASEYYTKRAKLRRRKYTKLSIGADLLQQIICNIKIRRAPTRHDNIDFKLVITKTSEILPLSIVVGDRGYDSEENHIMVREKLGSFSVIPARNGDIPIWKTYGRYRKQMKRGYSKTLYHHRNKDETIISVIKRLFGEHVTSRSVKTQNRELSLRCIAYNMHRLTNLVIMMISTEPTLPSLIIGSTSFHLK
jgi:Transposase DDE domain